MCPPNSCQKVKMLYFPPNFSCGKCDKEINDCLKEESVWVCDIRWPRMPESSLFFFNLIPYSIQLNIRHQRRESHGLSKPLCPSSLKVRQSTIWSSSLCYLMRFWYHMVDCSFHLRCHFQTFLARNILHRKLVIFK